MTCNFVIGCGASYQFFLITYSLIDVRICPLRFYLYVCLFHFCRLLQDVLLIGRWRSLRRTSPREELCLKLRQKREIVIQLALFSSDFSCLSSLDHLSFR